VRHQILLGQVRHPCRLHQVAQGDHPFLVGRVLQLHPKQDQAKSIL